jgi:hypothetical protein
VTAKLAKNRVSVPGAQVYGVVHQADKERRWPESGFELTDDKGVATLTGFIKGEPGATLTMDVFFIYKGETFQATTSIMVPC